MGPGSDPDDHRVPSCSVGMGKTGSRALQVALVRHRDLLARHGVIYPSGALGCRRWHRTGS